MTIQRMDNVLIVVDDLEAAKAFFAELGMELEGETQVEGPSVDSTVGLEDVRADIAMMRTPDGHGRVELTKFHTPPAVRAEPESAPANTPACAATVPNSSARSRSTRTVTGSASCVALRASSSDLPSSSAERGQY
jgi:catechol 2,3-dioxygenase-like lactoylglutathione lyase family enzyme